ncbi:unnamed protein product [Mycena citricolor]|uniref:Uncharacterized protein n=1 Tax=Mycena citricolor TaxID=2018698 RepID=A0AAD2K0S8_9AGAR|nr:unnamed protein product [Mycena citricolor]
MLSNVEARLWSTYAHITRNRITNTFFVLSLLLCFAQGVIQSLLYALDGRFAGVFSEIGKAAEIPPRNFTYLDRTNEHYTIRMCNDIPHGQALNPCTVIFDSGNTSSSSEDVQTDLVDPQTVLQDLIKGFSVETNYDFGGSNGVQLHSASSSLVLNKQCTQILSYPQQVLKNAAREDLTFIFLQFWLLGVSVYALGNHSVPHLLTVLSTRLLITIWSIYVVSYRSHKQSTIFSATVSAAGTPCGVDMFPTFFQTRSGYYIADAALSVLGLLSLAALSWRLLRIFNDERVAASHALNRLVNDPFQFFMAVQACLQMEVFVLVAATSLWVDVLATSSIRKLSAHTNLYDALIIATTVILIPWISLGWYGVRREHRAMMVSFLVLAFVLLAGWSCMFYSIVFRWSLLQWPYLACLTTASFILIIASGVLGTICWRNFDQGLAEYLNAEEALASSNFAPEVFKRGKDDHTLYNVDKGAFYTYDEPKLPQATFQGAPPQSSHHARSASLFTPDMSPVPGPLRGPPPTYDRPYIPPF